MAAILTSGKLLYSYHLMRLACSIILLSFVLINSSTDAAPNDLLIETSEGRFRIPAVRRGEQAFYPLSRLTAAIQCQLTTREERALVRGPKGTLRLTDGRALLQLGNEYILLSAPPWRDPAETWYVAEDFVARALSLIIEEPLRRIGPGHYRTGSESAEITLELINQPDQVRLILTPRRYTGLSIMEYSDRIEVVPGAAKVGFQFPPVRPNPRIVASIHDDKGLLVIAKGSRYARFEESRPAAGPGLVIDLFGVPSAIVQLPPRAQSASESPKARDEEFPVAPDESRFDQLQDWREGPIERRRTAVVIDPGHGGEDLGVATDTLAEKNVTLEVAFQIQSVLERAGYSCQLTRTRDVDLPLEKRSGVGNYYQPLAFISIHVGGAPSTLTRSTTVYVNPGTQGGSAEQGQRELVRWGEAQDAYRTQSRRLGGLIREQLGGLSENPTALVEAPLAVLGAVSAPAILVEMGQLTNPLQQAELQSEEYRESISVAIAKSVLDFLRSAESEDRQP